jgi:glycosyltransferase involved in cell wall biosynthesis
MANPEPSITAVVCTYNRSAYLKQTLLALVKQTLLPGQYEIIVVDNNSTDNTHAVLEEKSREFPDHQLRYVLETQQGLSQARNRGLREARSRYVAFIDDDALAARDWLAVLLDGFQNLRPAAVCIGGKVILDWEGEKPSWATGYENFFSCVDHGEEDFALQSAPLAKQWILGNNMAFDKLYLFENGVEFSTKLGRVGLSLRSGEESVLIARLMASGAPLYYLHKALVSHIVTPERRSYQWLVRRLIADGRSQPLIEIEEGRFPTKWPAFLRRVLYDVRMFLQWTGRGVRSRLRGNVTNANHCFFQALRYWGRTAAEVRHGRSRLLRRTNPKSS